MTAAIGLLSACTVDLGVPAGSQIACNSNDECPRGFRCTPAGLCLSQDNPDDVAPQVLGTATTMPPVAGLGDTLRVTFQVDEPLIENPTLVASNELRDLDLSFVSNDGAAQPTYVYAYTAQGDEAELASPIGIRMLDRASNITQRALGASLDFDFTLPQILAETVTIEIIPPDSLVNTVSAATVGSTVRITFTTSEPLTATPPILRQAGGAGFGFTLVESSSDRFVFEYQIDSPPPPDGAYADFEAVLVDDVGNGATVVVDLSLSNAPQGFLVDATPPAVPAVDTPEVIVYERIPWGAAASEYEPLFTVRGEAGAVEPGTTVVIFATTDTTTSELARTGADANGAFGSGAAAGTALSIGSLDLPRIYVAAVDAAGNVSDADAVTVGAQASRVRDIVWVASWVGTDVGNDFVNPHLFERRSIFTDELFEPKGPAYVDASYGIAETGGDTLVTASGGSWEKVSAAGAHPSMSFASATYDPARRVVVLFGGQSCGCTQQMSGQCSQTWERKGRSWHLAAPLDPEGDGEPSARIGAAMVYDPILGASLMFGGGYGFGDVNNETWAWNGSSWRQLCTTPPCSTNAPLPRRQAAMAYDPSRNHVVMFGGSSGGAETWVWNGRIWEQVCTAPPCSDSAPSAREAHAMAFDANLGEVLLVGGSTGSAETWSFDGTRWLQRCTTSPCSDNMPAGRRNHAMTFDHSLGEIILMGGEPDTCGVINCVLADVWKWDGARWAPVLAVDNLGDGDPEARSAHTLVYDPARGRLVLNGGEPPIDTWSGCTACCIFPPRIGTWEFDSEEWAFKAPVSGQPLLRTRATLVYDATQDATVLFTDYTATEDRTYLWRDGAWAWTGHSFPARAGAAIAYDSGRSRTVLYGGTDQSGTTICDATADLCQDTWELTPAGWDERCEGGLDLCGTEPANMEEAALTGLGGGPGVILWGGETFAVERETWYFDGTSWTNACGTNGLSCAGRPSQRTSVAMTSYGVGAAAGTLLFGGYSLFPDSYNDLWRWSGSDWVRADAATTEHPARRGGATMAYDPDRDRVVLYGGTNVDLFSANCGEGTAQCRDTWEWREEVWSRPAVFDPEADGQPPAGSGFSLAYSPEHEGLMLASPDGLPDAWVWRGGGKARPGHVVTVVFAAATPGEDFELVDLAVRWDGAGSGEESGVATNGASLLGWSRSGWEPLATNMAPVGAPTPITWSARTQDPAVASWKLRQRLNGTLSSLYFAVTSTAPNGAAANYAQVETDYVEVSIQYRLGAGN